MLYEDEYTTDTILNSIDVRFNNHPTAANNQVESFRWGAIGQALHGLKYEDKLWLNGSNYYVYVDNINNRISMFNGDIQPLRATWKNPSVYLANRNTDAKTEDASNKIIYYHYDLIAPSNKGTDPFYSNTLVNIEWGGYWKYQSLERELKYLNWYYSPRVGCIYRIYAIKTGFVANSNNRYFQIKYEVQDAESKANNVAFAQKVFNVEVDESLICGVVDYLHEGKYLMYDSNSSQYTYHAPGTNNRYLDNKYNLPYRLSSIKLDGSKALLLFYQLCPAMAYQRNINQTTGDYIRLKTHQSETIESPLLAAIELIPTEDINNLTLSFAFNQVLKSEENTGSFITREWDIAYTTPQGQPALDHQTNTRRVRTDVINSTNTKHLIYEDEYQTGIVSQGQEWYTIPTFESLQYYDAVYSYKENNINDIYIPYIYKYKTELTFNSQATTPPDRTKLLKIGFFNNTNNVTIFLDNVYSSYEVQYSIIPGDTVYFPQNNFSKLSSHVGVSVTRSGGTVNYRKFIHFYRICNYAWVLLTVETYGTDEAIISASDLATWKVYRVDGTLLEVLTMNNDDLKAAFGNDFYNLGSQQLHEIEYIGDNVYQFGGNTLPQETCVRYACLIDWFGSYDPINEKWSGLQKKPCVWV